ncbi:MAG: hypothetical protein PVF56_19500 [Desulfobacterales bacterium]|jgi:chromosome segregation ATPase
MRYRRIYGYLVFILLAIIASNTEASTAKTQELNRKLSEISSLQQIIQEKIATARATHDQLQKQIDKLTGEIHQRCGKENIVSYREAINSSRINYNIKLISQLAGYIDQLTLRITYFQSGNEMLAFLNQQILDDLRLIRTLNDMQIDRLIHRINEVLDEYVPETKKHIVSLETISWPSSEMIWNEIIMKD